MSWIGLASTWFGLPVDAVTKRVARFALHRTIGQFLKSKLQLGQIQVNAGDGTFMLGNLELDEEELGRFLKDTPLQIVSGSVDHVVARVPYGILHDEGCEVEVSGVHITLGLRDLLAEEEAEASDEELDDSFSSVDDLSASIAREFYEQREDLCEPGEDSEGGEWELDEAAQDPEEGLGQLKLLIDNILLRAKAALRDVCIRVEHYVAERDETVAVLLTLESIAFQDTTSDKSLDAEMDPVASPFKEKTIKLGMITAHLEVSKGAPGQASEVTIRRTKIFASQATSQGQVVLKTHDSASPKQIDVGVFLPALHGLLSPGQLQSILDLVSELMSIKQQGDASRPAEPAPDDKPASKSDMQIKFRMMQGGLSLLHEAHRHDVQAQASETFFRRLHEAEAHRLSLHSRKFCTPADPTIKACPLDHVRVCFSHLRVELDSGRAGLPSLELQAERMGAFECLWDGEDGREGIGHVVGIVQFKAGLRRDRAAHGRDEEPPRLHNGLSRPRRCTESSPFETAESPPDVVLKSKITALGPRVTLNLNPIVARLDLTLADRLHAYLGLRMHPAPATPSAAAPPPSQPPWARPDPLQRTRQQMGLASLHEGEVDPQHLATVVHITSPLVRLEMPVPVPEFEAGLLDEQALRRRGPPRPCYREGGLLLDLEGLDIRNQTEAQSGAHSLPGRVIRPRWAPGAAAPGGGVGVVRTDFHLRVNFLGCLLALREAGAAEPVPVLQAFCSAAGESGFVDLKGRSIDLSGVPPPPPAASAGERDEEEEEEGEEDPFADLESSTPSPYSKKFSARDGAEPAQHPGSQAELDAFEQHMAGQSALNIGVGIPLVQAHLRQDKYASLYGHVIDLSMWSPWVPPPPADEPLCEEPEAEGVTPARPSDGAAGDLAHAAASPGDAASASSNDDSDGEEEEEEDDDDDTLSCSSSPEPGDDDSDENVDDDDDADGSGDGPGHGAAEHAARARPVAGAQGLTCLATVVVSVDEAHVTLEENRDVLALYDSADADCDRTSVDPRVSTRFEIVANGLWLQSSLDVRETQDGAPRRYVCVRLRDLAMSQRDGRDNAPFLLARRVGTARPSPENMLSVVVCMDVDKPRNFKSTALAIDVKDLFLEHRCAPRSGLHWIFRLMKLVDAKDPEYPGFVPAVRLTKLQLHFLNLVIRYLPLGLPAAAAITASAIHLVSNVVPSSPDTVLSFLFEQAALHLIDDRQALAGVPSVDRPADLGYARMIHDPRVELTIQTTSAEDRRKPGLQVTVGNSGQLELSTCRDSFVTLLDVLKYYLGDGDGAAAEADRLRDELALHDLGSTELAAEATRPWGGGGGGGGRAAGGDEPFAGGVVGAAGGGASGDDDDESVFHSALSDFGSRSVSAPEAELGAEPTEGSMAASAGGSLCDSTLSASEGSADPLDSLLSSTFDEAASDPEDLRRSASSLSARSSSTTMDDGSRGSFSASVASGASVASQDTLVSEHSASASASTGTASRPAATAAAAAGEERRPAKHPHGTPIRMTEQGVGAPAAGVSLAADLADAMADQDSSGGSSGSGSGARGPGRRRPESSLLLDLDVNEDYFSGGEGPIDDGSSGFGFSADADAAWGDGDWGPGEGGEGGELPPSESAYGLEGDDVSVEQFALQDGGSGMYPGVIASALLADALQDPEAPGAARGSRQPRIDDGKVEILDREPGKSNPNHFVAPPPSSKDKLRLPPLFPVPTTRILLDNVGVRWRMCAGLDWGERSVEEAPRDETAEEAGKGQAKPARAPEPLERHRKEHVMLRMQGLCVSKDSFPDSAGHASRLLVVVQHLDILDRLGVSQINKFLCIHKTDHLPREFDSDMLRLEWVNVRTPAMTESAEEAIITLALLPLRLNIDQDALTFIVLHVAGVAGAPPADESDAAEQPAASGDGAGEAPPPAEEGGTGTYIKLLSIKPVFVKIDWEPKRVTYSKLFAGKLSELAGLVYLSEATLTLDSLVVKGVHGFGRLAGTVGNLYLDQVTSAQRVSSLLSGIPGVRPVSTVVRAGVSVIHEPILQYPRVLQGVRDGLSRGVQTTAVEFCNIGTTLAFALQSAFEVAQGVVARSDELHASDRSRFAQQPADAAAGFLQARHLVIDSFKDAYKDVAERPYRHGRRASGFMGSIGAVPGAGLRPFIALCEATSLTLQGIRNSLDPDTKHDLEEKYRK